jgi:hypothetical protein
MATTKTPRTIVKDVSHLDATLWIKNKIETLENDLKNIKTKIIKNEKFVSADQLRVWRHQKFTVNQSLERFKQYLKNESKNPGHVH